MKNEPTTEKKNEVLQDLIDSQKIINSINNDILSLMKVIKMDGKNNSFEFQYIKEERMKLKSHQELVDKIFEKYFVN